MARTAPCPDIPPIPGMCPSIAVLAGGGDGGGGGGKGAGDGSGDNNAGAGSGGENAAGDGRGAPDYNRYPQCGYASHPVDVVTGRAFTHPILDLDLPGPLPFTFSRMYSSKMAGRDSGLGFGWGHTLGWEIEVGRRSITVWNEQGIAVDFPMIQVGDETLGPWGWVLRRERWGFAVDADDGVWHLFSVSEDEGRRYRLSAIEDRNKNRIAVTYDDGRLADVTDSAGRVIRFASTKEGRIAGIQVQSAGPEGPWSAFTTYTYDGAGHLVSAADADGHASRYAYDDEHRLTLDVDRTGLAFHFVYDRRGRCVESWGDYQAPNGEPRRDPSLAEDVPRLLADGVTRARGIHHCKLEYHAEGYSEVVDSTQVRRFFGTRHGTLRKSVEGGGVMTATYRDDGHIISSTGVMGGVTHFERDARGRLTRLDDPLGRIHVIERDAAGLPVRLTDPAGGVTEIARDARGNMLVHTDPTGAVTSVRHDERGLITNLVAPTGGRYTYAYDRQGNLVAATDPHGATTRLAYDALGRLIARVDPLGAETRWAYSARGDLLVERDPLGGETRFSYDGERRLTQRVSPSGQAIALTWGGYHRLCSRRHPDGSEMRLVYNREGELIRVLNERGEVHHREWSASGLLVGETTFDGRELRYRRDRAGHVLRCTDGLRQVTENEYDLAGQLVKRTFGDDEAEELTYDPRGDLIAARGPAVEIRFERDPLGRILREVQVVFDEEHTVTSAYDLAGARVSRTTSLGHTETVTRGPTGERKTTVLDGEHEVHHRVDALGREIARALPGGGWMQSAYDANGRVSRRRAGAMDPRRAASAAEPEWIGERSDGASLDTAYRYDADDHLVEALDRARGGTRYDYDARGQLLARAPDRGPAELFRYDVAGNPYEAGSSTGGRAYGRGNRVAQRGDTEYRWDDDGRLIERRTRDRESGREEVWTYHWSVKGLLQRAEGPDGLEIAFAYDPLARRVRKRVTRPSARGAGRDVISTTRFVWDGDVLVHEIRTDANGATSRTYCFTDGGFEPVAHREVRPGEGGGWFHYVNDPIGTPERLLGTDGATACDLQRSAWGRTEARPGGKASTLLRFQGQYEDEETGLFYNRWRYYDADTGTYISADPEGLDAGIRAFGYGPNPTGWIDPLGLVLREATRMKNGGVQVGRVLTQDEAINRLGNAKNNDVHADSQAEAMALANAANAANGRTCTPIAHPAHTATAGPRALPHVHPDKDNTLSTNSHIFHP